MAGIAGIASADKNEIVSQMLGKMSHRGWAWHEIINEKETTLGMVGLKGPKKKMLSP